MTSVGYADFNDIDALIYGEPHPNTVNYLFQQAQQFQQVIGNAVGNFFTDAAAIFNQFNGEEALRHIRQTVRQVGNAFRSDYIRELKTMSELQTAMPLMQRYIMANPTIRDLYHRQMCDGYSDTYIDMYPTDIGEAHYDYRRVVNGVVFTESKYGMEVPDDVGWISVEYLDRLTDGDRELDLGEQTAVMTTWDYVEIAAGKREIDPTSIFGDAF